MYHDSRQRKQETVKDNRKALGIKFKKSCELAKGEARRQIQDWEMENDALLRGNPRVFILEPLPKK
jgi:hypothetical protein